MRHNQNGRMRGGSGGRRGNNGGGSSHTSHSSHGNSGGGNTSQPRRGGNPRVQTFDSNGPEVRIRGNAFQINEKYLTLARDAAAAGDRVLAESYYQHAEHYQRFISEINDDYARSNPQQSQSQQQPHHQQSQQQQPQPDEGNNGNTLEDLDQGFLVGPRGGAQGGHQPADDQPTLRRTNRQPETRESEAI